MAAPWVYGEQLTLWFEDELSTGVEDVVMPEGMKFDGTTIMAQGMLEVYNIQGILMARANGSINTAGWQSGIYIIKSATSSIKLLIP